MNIGKREKGKKNFKGRKKDEQILKGASYLAEMVCYYSPGQTAPVVRIPGPGQNPRDTAGRAGPDNAYRIKRFISS